MKKKIELACLLFVAILAVAELFAWQREKDIVLYADENGIALELMGDAKSLTLLPWSGEEEQYYFFMPSFVKTDRVYVENTGKKKVFINEELLESGSFFEWEENKSYTIKIIEEGMADREFQTVFMYSENLPSVFIATESGSLDFIHEDKDNAEAGTIRVISEEGEIRYSGELEKFSGRGNSTWDYPKKPYAMKLKNAVSLCGMERGKRWNLLAMWQESSKMNSKLAFDMAAELNLAYSPDGTWVDLYINNEYAGLYLLTESISVGEGRVDIYDLEKENEKINPEIEMSVPFYEDDHKGFELENSRNITGGYLIEKQWSPFFREEKSGFTTEGGFNFGIRSPEYASREQTVYIRDFVQMAENVIHNGNYEDYIDLDSFTKKYVIEEVSLNYDANIGSTYFYKEQDKDILYAGPVWDYDGAFGEHGEDVLDGHYTDYQWSILKPRLDGTEVLDWFAELYEEEAFYDLAIEQYAALLPLLEECLNERIDSYAQTIGKAVQMDVMRWPAQREEGHYLLYENNVRYLKYFLANRLNYLNERWQVEYSYLAAPANGELHQVYFTIDGKEAAVYQVEDGKSIQELPELDEEIFSGWYLFNGEERYRNTLPVYEDMVLYAKRKTD